MTERVQRTALALLPLAAGLLFLAAGPAAAQEPNASFTVSGNSTIRSWSCKAPGAVQIKSGAAAPEVPGLKGGVEAGTVTVQVRDLNCANDEMTQHLREAMQPERHATITYQLQEYTVSGGTAATKGNLTINGVTKAVAFPMKVQAAQGGGVRLDGETSIDMTEYKVEPPTVMFGALKVRPVVRVHFEATLR